MRTNRGSDGAQWYWADLPVTGKKVRVGFPASRVDVQPWLAMLLIFFAVGLALLLRTPYPAAAVADD